MASLYFAMDGKFKLFIKTDPKSKFKNSVILLFSSNAFIWSKNSTLDYQLLRRQFQLFQSWKSLHINWCLCVILTFLTALIKGTWNTLTEIGLRKKIVKKIVLPRFSYIVGLLRLLDASKNEAFVC